MLSLLVSKDLAARLRRPNTPDAEIDRFRAVERKPEIFLKGAPNSALICVAKATAPGPIMTPAEPVAKDGRLGCDEFQRCLQHGQLADRVMYLVVTGTIGGISTT